MFPVLQNLELYRMAVPGFGCPEMVFGREWKACSGPAVEMGDSWPRDRIAE